MCTDIHTHTKMPTYTRTRQRERAVVQSDEIELLKQNIAKLQLEAQSDRDLNRAAFNQEIHRVQTDADQKIKAAADEAQAEKEKMQQETGKQIEIIKAEAQREMKLVQEQAQRDIEAARTDAQAELDKEIAHVRKREDLLHTLLVEAERRIQRLEPGKAAREREGRRSGERDGRHSHERDGRHSRERHVDNAAVARDKRDGSRTRRRNDDKVYSGVEDSLTTSARRDTAGKTNARSRLAANCAAGDVGEDPLDIGELAGAGIGGGNEKWDENNAAGELQKSVERVRAELKLARTLQVSILSLFLRAFVCLCVRCMRPVEGSRELQICIRSGKNLERECHGVV